MKTWTLNIGWFFVVLLLSSLTSAHPLKLSASLVQYEPDNKSIRVECKVFMDDFELSLSRSVLKGVDVSTVKREERPKIIEAYFKAFYKIHVNGKRIPLNYAAVIPLREQNVLVIRFKPVPLTIKKGDRLDIENSMFFRDFGPAQTNRIAVRIPPFGIEEGRIATWDQYKISYTFGESKQ